MNQGETVAVTITLLLVYAILTFTWKLWIPALRRELASIHLKAKDLLKNPPHNIKQGQPMDVATLMQLDNRLLRRILKIAELKEKDIEAMRSEQQAKVNALALIPERT